MKPLAIIVAGVGHHARRIYIPELLTHPLLSAAVIVAVEVIGTEDATAQYISTTSAPERIRPVFVPDRPLNDFGELPLAAELLATYDIVGLVIATDPTHHMQYARWALRHDIHVLSDKPLSTHPNVTNNLHHANRLRQDFDELRTLQNSGASMCCLSTQRRYETSYSFVQELIKEVKQRFAMPVTSVQAFYSDGLWIFPDEVLSQRVHPFNEGYGMLSHSGFHILDAVWSFYQAGIISHKRPDTMETVASATYPDSLIRNFGTADYARLFGTSTAKDDQQYLRQMQQYGEVDITANHLLKQENTPTAVLTINMFHNSFSRRSWAVPSADLYKGNGRVKHQSYTIEQGPFQAIQIHNYQASAQHDGHETNSQDLGGKNHFDIHVFRNIDFFPEEKEPVRKYTSAEIDQQYAANDTKLSNEIAKSIMIDEFVTNSFDSREGQSLNRMTIRNSLDSYTTPVQMMTDLYKSLIKRKRGGNPLVVSRI